MPETVTERVVSVIAPPTAGKPAAQIVDPAAEAKLKQQTSELELAAEAMLVTNDAQFQDAAEFGKAIKAKANEITTFFKPMKDAAHKAHKEVCDREKVMLEPLSKAESILKRAMGDYLDEQEKRRRAAEEAARRAAKEEADRKLAEAIALEGAGDSDGAAAAIEDAELYDGAAGSIGIPSAPPKVKGVSAKKSWEITGIDSSKVPVTFSGMELRPVDRAAVAALIKASKGSIQIPGVTYREVTNMSISGR